MVTEGQDFGNRIGKVECLRKHRDAGGGGGDQILGLGKSFPLRVSVSEQRKQAKGEAAELTTSDHPRCQIAQHRFLLLRSAALHLSPACRACRYCNLQRADG